MKEENGPLIALLVFVVLSVVFGIFAYNSHKKLMGSQPDHSDSMDAGLRIKEKQNKELEEEILSLQERAQLLHKDIMSQQARYEVFVQATFEYEEEYKRREALFKVAQAFEQQATDLTGAITDLKNKTLTDVNKRTNEAKHTAEQIVQKLTTERDAAITRLRQAKEDFDLEQKKYRAQRNYNQSGLDDSRSMLADLTQRELERADIFAESDGKVILSDPIHNTVVINLGTAHGVKNGYRFEVYAMRPGNVRVRKAFVEVRKAGISSSDCVIVRRPVALPKDPLSEYVAQDPEEMFSPYQESGKKGLSAQRLSGKPKMVDGTGPELDPIVEEDLVQNPFFKAGKVYTYYIAGSKEVVNERQKSAIRYRWTEIKSVLESYGNKVVQVPDTTVDYVIAQKNPKDDPEFQKCLDLGLPVVYEWELFRFLESR